MATIQTMYLRDTAADVGASTLPSGYLGAWDYVVAAAGGANALSLMDTAGSATVTRTASGSVGTPSSTPKNYGTGQFASARLAAQSIGSGNWTFAFSARDNAASFGINTWQGYAALYLVNGATGAIRTTIFALGGIGSSGRTQTNYTTSYSASVSGASATATAGDYLVFEFGAQIAKTNTAASVNLDGRYGNSTAISADAATNANPQSRIVAPAALTLDIPAQTVTASDFRPLAQFGQATVSPGAVTVTTTGHAEAAQFGQATVNPGPVTVTTQGHAEAAQFGLATVSPGPVTITSLGHAEAAQFGQAVVSPGPVALGASDDFHPVANWGQATVTVAPTVEDVGLVTLALSPRYEADLALSARTTATLAQVGPRASLVLSPRAEASLALVPGSGASLALVAAPSATLVN